MLGNNKLIEEGKINNLYEYLLSIENMYNFIRDSDGSIIKETNCKCCDMIKQYNDNIKYFANLSDDELAKNTIESNNRAIDDYNKYINTQEKYVNKLINICKEFKKWNVHTERAKNYNNKIQNNLQDEINASFKYINDCINNITRLKEINNNFNPKEYRYKQIEYYNKRVFEELEYQSKEKESDKELKEYLTDYENSLKELKISLEE